jgi:plasmid stabilization system protein ParE
LPVALPVLFTLAARAEITEAQDWYEARTPGLGIRFRAELDRTVQRMIANPRQFPRVFQDVRRARLRTFPYGLFFRIEPAALLVIACFHASRDPRQRQRRV